MYTHKVGSGEDGEGRVYADLTPVSEVQRLFPIDPRLKKKQSKASPARSNGREKHTEQ